MSQITLRVCSFPNFTIADRSFLYSWNQSAIALTTRRECDGTFPISSSCQTTETGAIKVSIALYMDGAKSL
ncbi:MAG TPA: hypothetical protein V6D30_18370 [Leptolyngbyaceae cyanobacterium]